jgi:hypothetical protein
MTACSCKAHYLTQNKCTFCLPSTLQHSQQEDVDVAPSIPPSKQPHSATGIKTVGGVGVDGQPAGSVGDNGLLTAAQHSTVFGPSVQSAPSIAAGVNTPVFVYIYSNVDEHRAQIDCTAALSTTVVRCAFLTGFCTRGCHWIPHMFALMVFLSGVHSSYRCHHKSCRNPEGRFTACEHKR